MSVRVNSLQDRLCEKLNLLSDLVQQRERSDGKEYQVIKRRISRIKSEVKSIRQSIAANETTEQAELF